MRAAEELAFTTHDGTTLFYRHWPAATDTPVTRALVLFHRGHEHSGRLQHVVDELALPDCPMFAWDARGHGRSPGARGDSPGFGALVKDVDTFIRHIGTAHGIPPEAIAVIGQSVGAVVTATWMHDYAPAIRCLVLTAPALDVKLYVPFARPALELLRKLRGNFFITSYVKARFLTRDPARIRSYETDPLVTRDISARVLLGLHDAADRIIDDAQAIRLPVQMLLSESDWVVHRGAQDRFFERLGSTVKERHVMPGFFHDTLGERDRHLALDLVRGFLDRVFSVPPAVASQRRAHETGYTHEEERRLRAKLPALSPKNLSFAATRLSMRTLGRLAAGVRLGLATGFDSGATLDYVYRNEARGNLLLGKLIDRGYLDAIGWRGIRVRRTHLVEAITQAAGRVAAAGHPVTIADIAAGHGRYLLEAASRIAPRPQAIVLRDLDASNVAIGTALAASAGFADIARFEQGDAFDTAAVGAIRPAPQIIVASGIYELFSDNDLIARSLAGIAQAVPPGGFVVYTGQPWHPQIELIARTLTSHRGGAAWVMRRRTQAELDELVREAGFEKVEQWIDEWGIFTVSLARRVR
jgi:alpha-beta hydrolase superfamily lysophospholipase